MLSTDPTAVAAETPLGVKVTFETATKVGVPTAVAAETPVTLVAKTIVVEPIAVAAETPLIEIGSASSQAP